MSPWVATTRLQASRDSLAARNATAAAVRAASESLDACNRVVATHGDILAECSGTLQKVAGDADQCFVDQQTLTESWPK